MKKTLFAIAISSILFLACNNSNDSASSPSDAASDSTMQIAEPSGTQASPQEQPIDNNSPAPISPGAASSSPQPAGKTAAGMNPPHGEPGHRCDIDVGAPLNSPPKQAAPSEGAIQTSPGITPSVTPSPSGSAMPAGQITPSVSPAPASASTPGTTAPGMNPPHGQPGHDCAIAVGAPLKK